MWGERAGKNAGVIPVSTESAEEEALEGEYIPCEESTSGPTTWAEMLEDFNW